MAIAYDNSLNGNSSTSYSYTCSGSNRLLILGVLVIQPAVPTATYNGVSMTVLDSLSDNLGISLYVFYLLNPASGSNTLTYTNGGSGAVGSVAVSYTGVKQSSFPDSNAQIKGANTISPITASTTVISSNCWVASISMSDTNSGTATISDNVTSRQAASPVNFSPTTKYDACDTNGTVSTGSNSISFTIGGDGSAIVFSMAPALNTANGNFLTFM